MEPEASRAAIGAIAALQKRVRDLEDEAALLEDDHSSLLARMNERNDIYTIRENALNEATEKAKQILSTASTALIEIRQARAERERLKQQIEETERLIENQDAKIKFKRSNCKSIKASTALLMQWLAEYELLLGDIFTPPPQNANLSPEEIALVSSGEYDPAILPEPLSDILRNLQRLPKRFSKQKIETKRKIVRALCDAEAVLTDLRTKVKGLEKQKFMSSTPKKYEVELKRLAIHTRILSDELRRFDFTS